MKDLALWRKKWLEMQPKTPKPLLENLERDLSHGWLLPYLHGLDALTWGRWNYWAACQMGAGQLPDEPIPQIEFCSCGSDAAHSRKMLERSLCAIPNYGSYTGWSSSEYFDYFLSWLLFGFGHAGHNELPDEPPGCEGASMRLYQIFDLSPLILWPYDHFAEIFGEAKYGQGAGFFPTPVSVCEVMAKMTIGQGERDHRTERVCDPCVGTGRMLLAASNYSLRLYAQDILRLMCKATLVNGYLYAPWLSLPIGWLDGATVRAGNALLMEPGEAMNGWHDDAEYSPVEAIEVLNQRSETMVAQSPPHYQAQLFDSEFDAAGTRETFPVLKRRKRADGSTPAASEQMKLLEV
jgi:hypothetical protein